MPIASSSGLIGRRRCILVKFLSLKGEGFLSYSKFEMPMSEPGVTLVHGKNHDAFKSNGAGKSASFEMIVWVLWGTTIRGLTGDDVINRRLKKGCRGRLYIEAGGQTLLMERCRKYAEKEDGLNVFVRRGRKLRRISKTWSSTEAQEYVEKLIGMDKRTFVNTIYFGQNTSTKAFSEVGDAEQKRILSELLGLDLWGECLRITKDLLGEYDGSAEKLIAHAESLHRERANLDAIVAEGRSDLEGWEVVHAAAVRSICDDLDDSRRNLRRMCRIYQQLGDQDADEKIKVKMAKIKVKMYQEIREAEHLDTEWRILTGKEAIQGAKVAELEQYLDDTERLRDKPCPTCGQKIGVKAMKGIKHVAKEQRGDYAADVKRLTQERSKVLDKANAYRKEAGRLEDEARRLQDSIVGDSGERQALEQDMRVLKLAVKQLGARCTQLRGEENPHKIAVERGLARIDSIDESLVTAEGQIEKLAKLIDPLEFWLKGFGNAGIRAYLIEQAIPFLNQRVAAHAQELTDGTVDVEFSNRTVLKNDEERMKFRVKVTNKKGAAKYKGNSGGERKRVDICVQLALQDLVAARVQTDVNIRVFDEPFDALDDTERVVDMLQGLAEQGLSVFIITQDGSLRSFFETVYIAEKRDGLSRMRLEEGHG